MLDREIAKELPLINITNWNSWSTDVPENALTFSCDIQQEQATDSDNPLMEVTKVRIQGFARMRHVRQGIDETVGLLVDYYLNGEESTCTERREGECVRCREALDGYFSALEASYDQTVPVPDEEEPKNILDRIRASRHPTGPRPFDEIFVRQPVRLSWRDAFTEDGRFAPKAYGMSYDLNDAMLLVENAVREAGGEVVPSVVDEARGRLEEVITEAVTEHGITYENVGTSWRDCGGSHSDGRIFRWSSDMLATAAGGGATD